jgi:hypothetical protein
MTNNHRVRTFTRAARLCEGKAMTKDLKFAWMVGKVRVTHAGFGVYTLRGHLSLPADLVSGPHDSALKAVEAAEKLGNGHAAFRMVQTSAGVEAREPLSRDDLPINLV